jgi:hypothetical protein
LLIQAIMHLRLVFAAQIHRDSGNFVSALLEGPAGRSLADGCAFSACCRGSLPAACATTPPSTMLPTRSDGRAVREFKGGGVA